MDGFCLSEYLDRAQVVGSGLDQQVLKQMCHYE